MDRSASPNGTAPDTRLDDAAANEDAEPIRLRHPQETLEHRKGNNLLLTILAPYAAIMTLIAIWYFWKYQNYEAAHHPLEMMGDVGRVDLPRKKGRRPDLQVARAETPLPDRLKVKLGGSVRVGDLEVTPMRIEQSRFKFFDVSKNDQVQAHVTGKDGLILQLRLKNLSADWVFCPTDPLFDRSYDPKKSKPFTLLEVGKQFFYGGPLDQQDLGLKKRMYVEGQENDEKPLNPGEERLTVVCTDPTSDAILPVVNGSKDTMTWRVHLRRGVTQFRGHDYSVTAVVGVEFNASDVKKVAKN